jgi:hypothetical protein
MPSSLTKRVAARWLQARAPGGPEWVERALHDIDDKAYKAGRKYRRNYTGPTERDVMEKLMPPLVRDIENAFKSWDIKAQAKIDLDWVGYRGIQHPEYDVTIDLLKYPEDMDIVEILGVLQMVLGLRRAPTQRDIKRGPKGIRFYHPRVGGAYRDDEDDWD